MTPANHPPSERLLAYATGAADVTLRLLVETHLSFCDDCARRAGRLGAAGGAVLEAVPEAPVPPDLFARIWEEASRREQPRPVEGLPLPPALLAELRPPEHWRWHSTLSKGIRMSRLVRGEAGRGSLYLIHLQAGARFPRHEHLGGEEGVIVAGGVWDRGQFLEVGDWSSAPAGSKHQPVADPTEGCWVLVREECEDVRLSGWRGLVQWAASLRH